MKQISAAFFALFSLSLISVAHADVYVDGDAAAGKAKSATCVACHGVDGNSALPINPKLAGQNASYLYAQLKYFKDGQRKNAVMQGMVAALDDQAMKDIAVYFSQQTRKVGAADKTLVDLGEKLYRGGNKESELPACTGCHGPKGEGNPGAKYPALSGQHAAYTAAQLLAYRKELRVNPMADIMQGVTHFITDKEIEAVSSYIEGLH